MTTATFKIGESITIGLWFGNNYQLPDTCNMIIYIGGVCIGNLKTQSPTMDKNGIYYTIKLSGRETSLMRGYRDIMIVLDDPIGFGIRKEIIGGISFDRIGLINETISDSENSGYNMLIELNVTQTTITSSVELLNAIKGNDGRGILSNKLLSTNGLIKTYRITYTDNTIFDYDVTDGESGGVEEAPIDGNQYARQDGDWAQITIPESGIESVTSTDNHIVVDNTDPANPILSFQLVDNENLLTDDKLAKLDAIEEGAEVNIIEVVKVNNTPLTVTEKAVNIDLSGYSQTSHRHSGETITPDALLVTKTYSDAEIAALPTNTLFWDATNKTYAFKIPDGGIIQINQEPHDYYTNLEGAPIVNGDIVSSCGASGNRTAICLTDATNDVKAMAAFGMCTVATIANNNVGRITKSGGKVRGLNTIAYSEGTILYVDPLNKGKWTGTKPEAPNRPVIIGTVAVSHATEGVVELQIETLPKLTELADVDGVETTVASGSSFLFKLTSNLWKTITESNFITWIKGLTDEVFIGSTTPTGTEDIWIDPNSADVTTADIPDSTDKRYQTDYQLANKFGSGANYAQFDTNGNLKLYGNATQWEDLNFAPNSSGGAAATLPDYVTINNVTHREFTSANNQLCGDIKELPHSYKASSTLTPHLHLFLKAAESAGTTGVTFTLYWELRQGAGTTSGSLTLSATSAQLAANPNKIDIHGTAFAGASELGAQLSLRLARTAGDAGDVIVTTYGVHYEFDSIGSNEITTK